MFSGLYIAGKQLDEEKKQVRNISQLFQNDLEHKRTQVLQLCKQLIFKDYHAVGKKAREIMWHKCYYDFIVFVKKNWSRELQDATQPGVVEILQKLEKFLCAGILNYKRMAAKMEQIYDLDLKYLIDLTIINEGYIVDKSNGKILRGATTGTLSLDDESGNCYVVDKSVEAVSFALDTIHSCLLSLGDIHRYFLDFRIESKLHITREQASKYYIQAFKLNPAIGMAHNQLGTLLYGRNHDLDSIYYYLYSLVSLIPFELSENNVCKLFVNHANYLERLDAGKIAFSIEDFYARFYLIVDIFFFDKEVPEFNPLCHCVLVDLRKILTSKSINLNESSIFKIVSILFFCLSKLKMINSQKVYSLHAFLVAVCSDLMDACIVNLEQMILARTSDNDQFHQMYIKKFEEFDMMVRKSRNEYKNWLAANGGDDRKDKKISVMTNKITQKELSSDSRDSQRSHEDYICKPQDNNKTNYKEDTKNNGEPISTRSSDEAKESDLKTPLSSKSKKRGMKLRRRRRKIAQSDDSSCYDTESDMDTDFSTDEEDYTDLSSNFDTDFSDIEPVDVDNEAHVIISSNKLTVKGMLCNIFSLFFFVY